MLHTQSLGQGPRVSRLLFDSQPPQNAKAERARDCLYKSVSRTCDDWNHRVEIPHATVTVNQIPPSPIDPQAWPNWKTEWGSEVPKAIPMGVTYPIYKKRRGREKEWYLSGKHIQRVSP